LKIAALLLLLGATAGAQKTKLLVLSVDGLDNRYLRDADAMKLKIPNIRSLMKYGAWASDGVVGEVPTVTWPSHTTLLTGVPPQVHGILGNRRPKAEGGDYYWSYDLLKVQTLWDAAKHAGLTSASVTWPVTVDAPIDWNLPEYFLKRQGGAMDLAGIESKSTPGLVDAIAAKYPSFRQQWMDDRTRALATMCLLQEKQPDFMAVHFVDLDAEEHDTEPFSPASFAMLERTDELIGKILAVTPPNISVALVSDHGFIPVKKTVALKVLLAKAGQNGPVNVNPFWVSASDAGVATALEDLRKDPANGIGRAIPAAEWKRFMPSVPMPVAVYEPADGYLFNPAPSGEVYGKPYEIGTHGFWPARPGPRSVFVLRAPGRKTEKLGEMSILEIAPRLARAMGLEFEPAKTR